MASNQGFAGMSEEERKDAARKGGQPQGQETTPGEQSGGDNI